MSFQIPNIFDYATKELSQDAFISWLIMWSYNTGEVKTGDKLMYEPIYHASQDFIKMLLGDDYIYNIQVKQLHLQKYNADIIVEFENDVVLLIEDKVNALADKTQIDRYMTAIKKDKHNLSLRPAKPVLLITGNQDYIDDGTINIIRRKDIIECLGKHIAFCQNHVLYADFYDYMTRKEDEFNKWQDVPVSDWSPETVEGFYSALKDNGIDGSYGYASNAQGGLWYFYFKPKSLDNIEGAYFQIEAEYKDTMTMTLYLRVSSDNPEETIQTRNNILDSINNDILTPCRSRKGKTMRVGEIEFLSLNKDNTVNITKTISNINNLNTINLL